MRRLSPVLALLLTACAGVPVARHTFVFLGVGVVRVDKAAKATGLSSRSLGISAGCQLLTIGFQESYCVHIPVEGDVAIIESGKGPDQHFTLTNHRHREKPP